MSLPKLKLPDGLTYAYDLLGHRICTGSKMGRANTYPDDRQAEVKLRMVRLRWVSRDYDQGGAYWGHAMDSGDIYWATGENTDVFVRARSRTHAKAQVRERLPKARFYR